MCTTIENFCGKFEITLGDLDFPGEGGLSIEPSNILYIGTGTHGDRKPYYEDGHLRVGVTTYRGDECRGQEDFIFSPAVACLYASRRVTNPVNRKKKLLQRIQISRFFNLETEEYDAIYGLMVWGDPEQVGVWGAEEDGGGSTRKQPHGKI